MYVAYATYLACPAQYEVKLDCMATYRLSAEYLQGGDARTQLRFASKPNNSGLKLLPSPYTEKLKQEVATYIDRFRSIPAFLANLTMENFQKNMSN